MNSRSLEYLGGCRCGQLRYRATGELLFAGYCFCGDCRKSSGSGYVPFIGFASSQVEFSGETRHVKARAANGGEAVRNLCATCGSLVFGGIVGTDTSHTIYAGSLDDPSLFEPQVAIFVKHRPIWAPIPPGLTCFETMPD
jgi:hypothetical protein